VPSNIEEQKSAEFDDGENMSEDDDDRRTLSNNVNQMSTKLPFSAQGQATTEIINPLSARVLAGLIPSQSNKTKALSKEQEMLYR